MIVPGFEHSVVMEISKEKEYFSQSSLNYSLICAAKVGQFFQYKREIFTGRKTREGN
jgi:hypothetical protein